ncbi:unnamed protein product [Schistocephalus solidus]|uniref:Protein kinase domain-containing protein n=1 Tax=Schistocephalus solidus TaxID=70667 RepID=A0A183T173_SCHSO|nr:unnamed protein product [Schistocephalus solidus]
MRTTSCIWPFIVPPPPPVSLLSGCTSITACSDENRRPFPLHTALLRQSRPAAAAVGVVSNKSVPCGPVHTSDSHPVFLSTLSSGHGWFVVSDDDDDDGGGGGGGGATRMVSYVFVYVCVRALISRLPRPLPVCDVCLVDLAGTRGRPAMAHRSLSLDCVYMKADGVCCIGDLEYAVCAPPNPLPPLDHLTAVYLEHCREYAPGEFQLRQPVQQTSTRSCELSVATNLQHHHHHHQQADRPVCSLSTQSTTVAGGADRTTPKPSPSHSGGGGTGGHTDEGRSGEEVGQRVQDSCPGDSIRGEQKLHGVSEGLLRTLLATPSYPDWWPIFGVQLLTLSMNPFDFEAHKRADVYALGKIIWEVLVWGQRSLAFRGSEDHPSAAGAKRISLNSADLSAHGNRHWAPLSQCSGCRDAEAWCRHSSVSKVIVSERLVTENSSQRASIEILEKCCSESQLPAVSLLFKGAYIQPAAGSNETEIPDLCRPFQGGPPNQWHPLPLTSCFVSTETPATYSRPLDGSSAQMVSTDQPISCLLQRLGLVIAECRQPRPELRLSALRVKKTLLRLVSEFFPKEEEEEEEKEENEATSSGETAAKPVGEIEYSGINLFLNF